MNTEKLIDKMIEEGLDAKDAVSLLLGEIQESADEDQEDEIYESTEDEIAEMIESGDLIETTVEIDGEEYPALYSESMGGYFIQVEDDEDEADEEVDEE